MVYHISNIYSRYSIMEILFFISLLKHAYLTTVCLFAGVVMVTIISTPPRNEKNHLQILILILFLSVFSKTVISKEYSYFIIRKSERGMVWENFGAPTNRH